MNIKNAIFGIFATGMALTSCKLGSPSQQADKKISDSTGTITQTDKKTTDSLANEAIHDEQFKNAMPDDKHNVLTVTSTEKDGILCIVYKHNGHENMLGPKPEVHYDAVRYLPETKELSVTQDAVYIEGSDVIRSNGNKVTADLNQVKDKELNGSMTVLMEMAREVMKDTSSVYKYDADEYKNVRSNQVMVTAGSKLDQAAKVVSRLMSRKHN